MHSCITFNYRQKYKNKYTHDCVTNLVEDKQVHREAWRS